MIFFFRKTSIKKYIKSKPRSIHSTMVLKISDGSIYTIYRMIKTSFQRTPYIGLHVLNNNCALSIARSITN